MGSQESREKGGGVVRTGPQVRDKFSPDQEQGGVLAISIGRGGEITVEEQKETTGG